MRNFFQLGGALLYRKCRSTGDGGGLLIIDTFVQTSGATAVFHGCSAASSGGGMRVRAGMSSAGSNSFTSCTAAATRGWVMS